MKSVLPIGPLGVIAYAAWLALVMFVHYSIQWIWGWAYQFFNGQIQAIYDGVASVVTVDVTPIIVYLEIAQNWFPVTELAVLWGLVVTFMISFAAIKIVVKLIPTVG